MINIACIGLGILTGLILCNIGLSTVINFNLIFLTKEGKLMMAMLFAQRIILGKTEFSEVPAKLQAQVAEILVDECGLPDLVPQKFGGNAPDPEA